MQSTTPTSNKSVKKKRPLILKIARFIAWFLGSFILLVLLVLLLIQIPAVQNIARKKVVTFLENKLHTKVAIGKLDIDFPSTLSLENVFFEDQSKDTLLYGGALKVNLKMFRLLRNDIQIEEIALENILAKVRRLPPDSVFNFQFIADAFSSKEPKAPKKESSLIMDIDHIKIKNTRIIYKDAFTGNDMDLAIGNLQTDIDKFDIKQLLFDIPSLELDGLTGHFIQLEPLQKSIEKTVTEAAAKPEVKLQLFNKEMKLSNINFKYISEPYNLNTSYVIGHLLVHPKTLDLKKSIITLNDATLSNSNINIEIASKETIEATKDTTITVAETPSFKILAGKLNISNSHFNYDDKSSPKVAARMDYGHLHFSEITLAANNLMYSKDTIRTNISKAKLKEQSGFVLNELRTKFEMNPTAITLDDLYIKTPGSEIKRLAYIRYPSLKILQSNTGLLDLDLDLADSKITSGELLLFVPQLKAQLDQLSPSSTFYLDARITGKLNDLNFQKLKLKGLSATDIDLTGKLKGLPDPNHLYADLNIRKFQSSSKDILSILPKNTVPANITLPQNIAASGIIKGGMENFYTDLAVNSSLGDAKITGTLAYIADEIKAQYDLAVTANQLQLHTLLRNPQLGPLTANIKIKGTGYEPETAKAEFNGALSTVTLNKYTYQNIQANGNIANKIFTLNADINDPNVVAVIKANGVFNNDFPEIQFEAEIDSIVTLPLHLTNYEMKYHGKIKGNFVNTDPDNLQGNLLVTNSILLNKGERSTMDTLEIIAANTDGIRSIGLNADFISANIKGQYTLTQLGSVFQQAIDPYFSITASKDSVKLDPYKFSIQVNAINNPTLRALVPEIKEMRPITLTGNFASDSGWNILMNSPRILYGALLLEEANITAGTKDGVLVFNTSLQQLTSNETVFLHNTRITGDLHDNKANFNLIVKDREDKDKYHLSGLLAQPVQNDYTFSLNPDSLLLNYDKWTASANNSIQYVNKEIIAKDFTLMNGTQKLSINSTSTGANIPLQVDFEQFKLSTLSGFIQEDSLFVNGLLNGNAFVKNIGTQPVFTSDFTIKDLSFYNDTIGNLTGKVHNNIANTYRAEVNLTGKGNEVNIAGDYIVKPSNSSFDFLVDIGAFQMRSLEGLTKGGIKEARGNLYGKVALKGNLENPVIDGKIQFNKTAFNVSMLNNVFRIDDEAIAVINNQGIKLNTFTIRDTTENQLVIDGDILSSNFMDYSFDFTVRANNFQAINSTKKDNNLFYGKMVFTTRLMVKGTPTHPIISGDLTINDLTDFSVVLPQEEPGIADREGIVRFVDYSATRDDSLFMQPYDSLNVSPLRGYDVAVNISVNKEATFNLIVDAGNGDFLRIKGLAQLTGGIDPSGKITLVGSYELDEGSYDLSFNFLKRKFLIQEGSRIVWTGEPTSAQIDITAVYEANTAPFDLVQGQVVGDPIIYKQRLPFEVNLKMAGELLKPVITFDIILPEEQNYNVSTDIINNVQAKLVQLRQEPAEMNKQVFALLLLKRFVGQNPFDNGGGGGLNANTFAKQSVSKILTEQLNSLAEGLIEAVDINFDLATTEDYTTGTKQDRTDLNVGISKRLLNDRLTVTVGSNFELEGPQQANQQQNNVAGNISINYKLTKDGRYALRAYRKNDYTGALEGYIVETGVGFLITVDYNRFREIFISKEKRQKKREINRANKIAEEAEAIKKELPAIDTPATKPNTLPINNPENA